MKIHILFEFRNGPWGGGNQFLKALRNEFIKMGVYQENIKKADLIIFNSHHLIEKVKLIKKKFPEKLFIHRLDGPVQSVRGFDEGIDDIVFEINELIADGTIFQSNWIKKESEKLGLKINRNNTIIINAPDCSIFNREEVKFDLKEKIRLIATSWSGNLRKGFDIYKWLDSNLDFSQYEMTFVGNSPIEFKNIIHKEPMNSVDLSSEIKKHHIYITASKYEPCSNALIEAMHCGLPAIAYNNGGNPEIVGGAGELFTSNEELIKKIQLVKNNYSSYSNQINLPSISEVALQYYNFCLSVYNLRMIYIPFPDSSTIGGPSTFMYNLKRYMKEHGFSYASKYKNASGIFFPIEFDEKIIKLIKSNGCKIIQRLDGIYYPSKHGDKYIDLNAKLKNIYLNYADHVIFQSEYSRKQCFEILGMKSEAEYSLIYNGVHKDIFYPDYNGDSADILRIVTTGNFRNIDMIEPVIDALDLLQCKFKFEFHIAGPIVNDDLKKFFNRNYIVHHGNMTSNQISELLRASNLFVYSHLNPPCPNSVIEAISTGLPVVGFDSGAMSELCWFSKDLLVYVSDDIFQKYEDFKPEILAQKIELCINNYGHYRDLALEHSYLYSFEDCGAKYLDVFNRVLSNVKLKKNYFDKIKKLKDWIPKK